MAILYLWFALIILIVLMLVGKLIAFIVLAFQGKSLDWYGYNKALILLSIIAFFPIALLWALVKRA